MTLAKLSKGELGRKECRTVDGVDVCMRVDIANEQPRLASGQYELQFIALAPESAQFVARRIPGSLDWSKLNDCSAMVRRVTQFETWEGCEIVTGPFKGGLLTFWRHRLNTESVLTITTRGFRESGLKQVQQVERPRP
jgi:hypothetical protein